jgi:hypothetical protein
MELEQQVCSLELAKRLKQLGVKQECLFYWDENWDSDVPGGKHWWSLTRSWERKDGNFQYSAFTVAELGEMLPKDVWFQGIRFERAFDTFQNDWVVGYYYNGLTPSVIDKNYQIETKCAAPTEADARAKMLIYLLENKLLTLQ